jgi:hypothetical protein
MKRATKFNPKMSQKRKKNLTHLKRKKIQKLLTRKKLMLLTSLKRRLKQSPNKFGNGRILMTSKLSG